MYSMINYGQRIDLLIDLMNGKAEAKMADYRREWASVERLAKTDPNVILTDLISDFMNEIEGEPKEIQRVDLTMSEGRRRPACACRPASTDGRCRCRLSVVAYSPDQRPIMLNAFAGEQWIAGSVGGYFVSSLKFQNWNGDRPRSGRRARSINARRHVPSRPAR